MSLEKIVRPFQTTDVTPPRRVITEENAEAVGNVVLSFGASGSGKTFNGSFSYSNSTFSAITCQEIIFLANQG